MANKAPASGQNRAVDSKQICNTWARGANSPGDMDQMMRAARMKRTVTGSMMAPRVAPHASMVGDAGFIRVIQVASRHPSAFQMSNAVKTRPTQISMP